MQHIKQAINETLHDANNLTGAVTYRQKRMLTAIYYAQYKHAPNYDFTNFTYGQACQIIAASNVKEWRKYDDEP